MPAKLKLSFSKTAPKGDITTICLIGKNGEIIPHLDKDEAAHLIRTMAVAKFTGKFGKSLMVYTDSSSYLLVGIGNKLEVGIKAERLGGKLFAALQSAASNLAWMPDHKLASTVLADVLLGANLASYHFDRYFTENSKDDITVRICVGGESLSEKAAVYQDRVALAKGVFLARDLVFEPANKLYPVEFANRCKALNSSGLEVEILDEAALQELGMGALLGVGQGSRRESRLVVMNWRGGGDEAPFAFVGKGVTFDTGGISLKPAKGMEDMKWDMGGAAAVTGAMCAIAERKVKMNIVGVVGLVENMPDGNAQRPGDVVTAMSGKTIEVINTDAEGRLVLADALHYTETRFAPQAMVDLATLTGAIIASLGKEYGGLFANSNDLASQLEAAGRETAESVWRMPMGDSYDRSLKSHIADMKNIGGPYGGAITAACFLARFVANTPWAHLDIAGKAWSDSASDTVPKGGTGYGVRLLNRLIDDWQGASVSNTEQQNDD
jgi:leucyl aminopeptidase